MTQSVQPYTDNQDIDFKRIFRLVLNHWWIIVLCLIIGLGIANLYNRYVEPIYSAAGTIIVKDESSSSLGADAAYLKDFDIFQVKKSLSTEIEIIKSHSVVEKAVQKMDFVHTSYFAIGRFKTTELYKDTPFIVEIDTLFPQAYERTFYVVFDEKGGYKFIINEEEPEENTEKYSLDQPVQNAFGHFTIKKNPSRSVPYDPGTKYSFVVHWPGSAVWQFRGRVGVGRASEDVSILIISSTDNVPERAADFVNALIDVYQERGKEEKTKVAENTIKFINTQLSEFGDSLDAAEEHIEYFKRSKGIVNLSPEFALGKFKDFDSKKMAIELELQALDAISRHIQQGKDASLITTTNLGTEDPRVSSSLSQLNEFEISRKNRLAYLTASHPELVSLDKKIALTRQEVIKNITSYKDALKNNLQTINGAISNTEMVMSKNLGVEREFITMNRKYSLYSNIYQLLLQKRQDASIAKEATVSDNLVLDRPGIPSTPFKPKRSLAYNLAIFVSLLVSLSYIFGKDLLDTTISERSQIERATKVPILGSVSHARRNGSSLIVAHKPKSSVAESFRSIRTNLQFLASQVDKKVVVVTSTVGEEGKTFFSLNIASILAISDKKVLLIGLDLRKPKLHLELGLPADEGISKILIGKSKPEDVIFKTSIENFDVLPAGPVPPNPSELIMSMAMQDLMENLKQKYDYIFIDTPPVGLVTDALVAMKYADITIYILRHKKSKRDYIENVNKLYRDQAASNLAIVLNDVKAGKGYGSSSGYGYGGYGYGYGYYEDDHKLSLSERLLGWLPKLQNGKHE